VYGVRVKREAPMILQASYKLFYRLFRATSYVPIPVDAGDFSLLDRRVVIVLNNLPENNRFIRGLRAWAGFKQVGVPYVRPERMFGRTTNNWLNNLRWARKAIFSFSYVPLQLATSVGFGIAVQQGSGGDAYHMYPFFSGLGGYIFGTNHAGNLDPSDIGVANPTFLKNAPLITKWNKEGLINSKVDGAAAQNAFLKGQAAFWITGPWNSDTLKKSGLKFKVIQMPAIAKPSVPFLGVQGFMVTKFAATHGVGGAATDLVTNFMASPSAQTQLAAANGRPPANIKAHSSDPVLAQFSAASKGGVPMPNIPQMNSVWGDLGQAWVKSTKGAGATKASVAFKAAARSIADKIG